MPYSDKIKIAEVQVTETESVGVFSFHEEYDDSANTDWWEVFYFDVENMREPEMVRGVFDNPSDATYALSEEIKRRMWWMQEAA